MATSCGFEFQAKNFGFFDVSPDKFYHLQWTKKRWVYMIYRLLVLIYMLVWLILDFALDLGQNTPGEKPQYRLLSNWGEYILVLYFFVAFVISIVGLCRRHNDEHSNAETLPWYLKMNWALFTMATTSAFVISIFYWVLIGRTRSAALNLRPRTIHLHITNSLLALIDIFMVAFPIRFLHFIYVVLFAFVYTVFILIMHWTGVDSAIYPVLDWVNNPGVAAGYNVAAAIVLPIVIQAVSFGLYHLRACIARATVLKNEKEDQKIRSDASLEMGNVNTAFEDSTPNHKPTEIYPDLAAQ